MLQVINETLAGMQGLVEGMSRAVNGQLDWVVAQLGGANRGLRLGKTNKYIKISSTASFFH